VVATLPANRFAAIRRSVCVTSWTADSASFRGIYRPLPGYNRLAEPVRQRADTEVGSWSELTQYEPARQYSKRLVEGIFKGARLSLYVSFGPSR
jgi:hypothetical protein